MSSPTHESRFYHPSDSQPTLPSYNSPHTGRQGRPLIDLVTNEWACKSYRDSSFESTDSYSHAYFMSEKDSFSSDLPTWIRQLSFPRRVQRYLLGYAVFLVACWFTWLYYLEPAWAQERLYDASLAALNDKEQSFGANIRPEFTDMIHLKTLDADLLPGSRSSIDDRRLIVVGDVHGCKDELSKLLDKVGFVKGKDHLILAGDMIAKGPDSRGVIDMAVDLGADAVRGNWEDRTLLAYDSLVAKVHPLPGPQEDPNTRDDFLDEQSFSHGDYKDRAMAKELDEKHIKWLQSCPVILKVGAISGFNGGSEIVVVHAGLVPGIDLDRQDPFLVMNMRSIDVMTRVPSEYRKGEPWEKLWNHYQSHTHPASQRQTVIYGHDSKTGLNIHKYSKGLDSGCVKGGELTAFVVDQTGKHKIAPLYDQIVLFGDSITEFGETCNGEGIGHVAALRRAYIRRLDVVNRGFSGYNTDLALRVMHKAIPSASDANIRIMGLFFGANDSCLPTEVNNQCVPLPEFKCNMTKLLRHPNSSGHKARMFLITNPPVIEEMQYAIDKAKGYPLRRTAENTKKYADAIRDLGREHSVPVVDLWSAIMLQAGWTPDLEGPLPGCMDAPRSDVLAKYLIDGLHLTPAGYQLLYNTIMRCIALCWPDQLPEHLPFILPHWDDGDAWKMRGETGSIINHRMRSAQPRRSGGSSIRPPSASL
ncbi:hypothetical protein FKW77_000964 [Venturia effusa]|uniref:SGNH hydrolase-type esterase domain-containing protein n=1 Tax=Venturia effusa TaxID=50376 RepID=A0A517LGN5_9PEZI|nr:hypothetical protein FKW77_000964 [Venturia effusa]